VPYHSTKLDKLEAPIVIVESALDAIILYQEAGDLVHAIAMGSAQNKPDAYLKALMSKATDTFVCMDYDNAGFEAAKWWKDKFPAVKICFIPKGKDVGDYHIEGGPVRNWVEALITNDTVPERPQPKIDIYIIDEKEDAEGLLNSIRDSEAVPGVSISENYLGIAVGDQTFAIDLHKVPPGCLVSMEDMAVIAHDGVDFLEKLSKYNLTCGHTESTRLQHLIIIEMLWDHEKLAQHRLGFGSGYFAGEQAQTALAAYINWEIYQLQEEILKKNNLEKAYQLYAGAQPALAEIRMTGSH